MGNGMTDCCQMPWTKKSFFKSSRLHPNSHQTNASLRQKKGRRKNIRFVDNKKSKTNAKSSYNNDQKHLSKVDEVSASNPLTPREHGNNNDIAVMSDSDSHLSSIEDVDDINSIFEFEKWIGDGKFGTVFLGHPRKKPSINVAIKVIPQSMFSHRIEKELNLLKSISHKSIIRYLCSYKDSQSFYVVTEYCDGGELFEKIRGQNGIDELDACKLMNKILSAVKYLHGRNIWHRDLKLENILIKHKNDDSRIKLIDFGLSKQLKGKERMHKKLGTPYYIAPEILEGNYGMEVDMWSLGVITYVLMCGYPPFYGEGPKELFRNIYNVKYTFVYEDWSYISDEAKDFISKLLVKDPRQRLTVDEALAHPWIESGCSLKSSSNKLDELNSNTTEIKFSSKRIILETIKRESFSKSVECTTLDSHEKWMGLDKNHSVEEVI